MTHSPQNRVNFVMTAISRIQHESKTKFYWERVRKRVVFPKNKTKYPKNKRSTPRIKIK